jgi:hypothetical protein
MAFERIRLCELNGLQIVWSIQGGYVGSGGRVIAGLTPQFLRRKIIMEALWYRSAYLIGGGHIHWKQLGCRSVLFLVRRTQMTSQDNHNAFQDSNKETEESFEQYNHELCEAAAGAGGDCYDEAGNGVILHTVLEFSLHIRFHSMSVRNRRRNSELMGFLCLWQGRYRLLCDFGPAKLPRSPNPPNLSVLVAHQVPRNVRKVSP